MVSVFVVVSRVYVASMTSTVSFPRKSVLEGVASETTALAYTRGSRILKVVSWPGDVVTTKVPPYVCTTL
jgi:hypothetical protein